MSNTEAKTSNELQQIVADEGGLSLGVVKIIKIGDEGDFSATVIGGHALVRGGARQSDIEAICDRLRLKYRLKD